MGLCQRIANLLAQALKNEDEEEKKVNEETWENRGDYGEN